MWRTQHTPRAINDNRVTGPLSYAEQATPSTHRSISKTDTALHTVPSPTSRVDRVWTINGRFLTQRMTGVQRYAHEIVRALDDLVAEQHPYANNLTLELYVPGKPHLPTFKHIQVRHTHFKPGHFWEQALLPVFARGKILSLCNTGPVLKRNQIVCVHDLNFMAYPQSYSFAFRTLYRILVPQVLRTSSGVATVSAYSAKELSRAGLVEHDQIRVIPNGHEHAKRWTALGDSSRNRIDRRTIVVIGSPAAHKNVDLIFRLSDQLRQHGLRVAIVGGLDSNVFRSSANASNEVISWLGKVTDDELASLYKNCLCLAFPSRAEGFGLPPLEAMTLGCPVVSSSAASMPEVCGNAALYADPDDAQGWIDAFLTLASDSSLRSELIENGHKRAAHYSWRASAICYLDAMARIDQAQMSRAGNHPIAIERLS